MSDSYRNNVWFQTRINMLSAILDMVNAERNVYLAAREYVFTWEMVTVMVYIRDHIPRLVS